MPAEAGQAGPATASSARSAPLLDRRERQLSRCPLHGCWQYAGSCGTCELVAGRQLEAGELDPRVGWWVILAGLAAFWIGCWQLLEACSGGAL